MASSYVSRPAVLRHHGSDGPSTDMIRTAWLLLLLLLLLLCLELPVTIGEGDSPFAIPVEAGLGVEYYDHGAKRFAIFMQKATWQEAKKLCAGQGGRLVEYVTEDIPVFIGRALAESAIGFTSLWIGGEFTPGDTQGENGMWKWTVSQQLIDAVLSHVDEFPMTSPPFWVDRPDPKVRMHMCLATDRNMHHLALIVAEPCDKKRPYICTLGASNETLTKPIKVTPAVKVGRKKFHLFLALTTWEESMSLCREIGMKLAKVTTNYEFEILKNRMQRSRPIMENAWVSGANSYGKWVWMETYEPINVDKTKVPNGQLFPWYRPDNIIMDGCLLVDRHVCERLVYVEAMCDRRRNYICEEDTGEEPIVPPMKPIPGGDGYYISNYEETWFKARNVCQICLGGELFMMATEEKKFLAQLPMLYTAMALTLKEEIRHIWVGGYLFGHKFKWTNDEKTDPGDGEALSEEVYQQLSGTGEKGIVTYCESDFAVDTYLLEYKCLNLDRENQKNFLLYGLTCYNKQHYICYAPSGVNVSERCLTGGEESLQLIDE